MCATGGTFGDASSGFLSGLFDSFALGAGAAAGCRDAAMAAAAAAAAAAAGVGDAAGGVPLSTHFV